MKYSKFRMAALFCVSVMRGWCHCGRRESESNKKRLFFFQQKEATRIIVCLLALRVFWMHMKKLLPKLRLVRPVL